jgi:Zn-dependent M28 family amino/carboxypeptidase
MHHRPETDRVARQILRRASAVVVLWLSGALALAAAQSARKSPLIDSAQLLHDLQVLSADDMQGRQVGTEGGAKARAYVIDRFKAAGLKPFGSSYEEPFTFASARRAPDVSTEQHGVNIVGRVDGTSAPTRFIVVSAHYDHLGVRNGQVYNGADDNASGTAGIISVAAYLAAHPLAHSVIVVAFDGEEAGLQGSKAFVKQPPVELSAIAVDVNLDMIGRDPNDKLFAVGTHLNPFLKPHVEHVAAASPIKLLIGHDDPAEKNVEDWTRDSDHWSFQQAGVPAIYLGDEDFDQHHKPTDDYETMTYSFFIGATETSIALVKELDANFDAIAQHRGGR